MCVPKRVLFVCDENRSRSPTAEALYCDKPGLEVRSAGISSSATCPLSEKLLEWADLVFVMERHQRDWISEVYPDSSDRKTIINLHIRDEYEYMDPLLAFLLEAQLREYRGSAQPG